VTTYLASGSPIGEVDEQSSIGNSGGVVPAVAGDENSIVVDDGSFFSNGRSGLVVAVANDEQKSIAVLSRGDEKIRELEVDQGTNYEYASRSFGQGGGNQFGYDIHNVAEGEAEHFRHEVRRPDGTVLGRYGYRDPNGDLRITNYISDKDGFQILKPGVVVQLEPVVDAENVQANEDRGRSNIVDEEPEAPEVHVAVPHTAIDLNEDPNTYAYYQPLF